VSHSTLIESTTGIFLTCCNDLTVTPADETVRCDLDSVGALDPAEGWREVFSSTLIPFAAYPDPASGDRFAASGVRQQVGDLSLVEFRSGRGTAHRGRREIAATHGDPLGVMLMHRGRGQRTFNDGSAILTAGQGVLWDGTRPGSFTNIYPTAHRTLMIPRERLRAAMPNYEIAIGYLRPNNPAVQLLTRYLATLESLAPRLGEAEQLIVADATIDLVCAALGASLSERPHQLRLVLLTEARRYIEAHLSDSELGPVSVARAHAVSVRTLHEVFEAAGESVSALIRRRRLLRAYADLARSADDQVITVALRWGFQSASHFSRAFRHEFGVSPRDVRPPRR
jgi:AraC family transcriptional activator of tynA and feaB